MDSKTHVTEANYGVMPDGRDVKIFTLANGRGLKARVTEYGAILVSMEVPDKSGSPKDVTHGYDSLAGWLTDTYYFGATIGRFGNRIKDGKFSLAGKEYPLATNNSPGGIPCHLHGGVNGFDKALWSGKPAGTNSVEFSYTSKDGEEGYPGNLEVKVTYTLTDQNELVWQATAVTDAPTILNLVHHSYWNLSGDPTTSIEDHLLELNADHFLPTDAGMIPTGEIVPVAGTPMDFTKPTQVGERIDAEFTPLQLGAGYDHAWVLEKSQGLRLAARLRDPKTGRVMEVVTNQPAVQFYTGNFIGNSVGKGGVAYARRSALCLETQAFPNAPNQANFPSTALLPGETYLHTMIHKFTAE